MILSVYGRKLLKIYNKKNGVNLTPKEFFLNIYHPIFYGGRYMDWMNNSPFVQGLLKETFPTTKEETDERLEKFLNKIDNNDNPDASIAIGFPAETPDSTTSGQVTNIKLQISEDEIYCSWIGSGLAISVDGGGYSIIFDNDEILFDIFNGWKIYRQYLDSRTNLICKQISSWNGQWLNYRYDSIRFNPNNPYIPDDGNFLKKENNELVIKTVKWVSILTKISMRFDLPNLNTYIYKIGKLNSTVGFIQFNLSEIKKPFELYQRLFKSEYLEKNKEIYSQFGTKQTFGRCLEFGCIGMAQLEPADLNDKTKQNYIFNSKKIWLYIMINNENLWKMSEDFAKILDIYLTGDDESKRVKSTTTKKRKIEELLKSNKKETFAKEITELFDELSNKELVLSLMKEMDSLTSDKVRYLISLIDIQLKHIRNKNN